MAVQVISRGIEYQRRPREYQREYQRRPPGERLLASRSGTVVHASGSPALSGLLTAAKSGRDTIYGISRVRDAFNE